MTKRDILNIIYEVVGYPRNLTTTRKNNLVNSINELNGSGGTDGKGWTGGSYDASNGVVTFTSDDGLGFVTGDLRGQDGVDGVDGADGQDGVDGTNGSDGQGVPSGGTAKQILEKVDGVDYNTQWVTPPSGGTVIDFFQTQDNSGSGQTLTSTTYTDVNSSIWSTAFTGTGFSWDGTELTVTAAADAIEFNVSIQGITTNNNRVELGVRLMEDTGSGYNTLTTVTQYALRNNGQNEGNVTLVSFYTFNVSAGTKYKIQVNRAGVNCEVGTQGGTYFNAKRFS